MISSATPNRWLLFDWNIGLNRITQGFPILSSRPEVFCKKGVLKNFGKYPGKHLLHILFFNELAGLWSEACNLIKKETLAQVFSCDIAKFFENIFLYKTSLVAAFLLSTFLLVGFKFGPFHLWILLFCKQCYRATLQLYNLL